MLEDACKVTSLNKIKEKEEGVLGEDELPSSSTFMSTISWKTKPSPVFPHDKAVKHEYRHPKPSLPRTDIKYAPNNHSDGDSMTDKRKDNRVFYDIIHRSGCVDEHKERRKILNPKKEFGEMNKCIEGLMVSNERAKRDLLQLVNTVERFKMEVDSQRVNSQTKELEAILLINENARLREELDELRDIISIHNIDISGYDRARSASCISDMSSPRGDIRRGKYIALAPISKPKIYRRSTPSLTGDDVVKNAGYCAKKHQTSLQNFEHRSHSDTCAIETSCNTAEASLSTPNIISGHDTPVEKPHSNAKKNNDNTHVLKMFC